MRVIAWRALREFAEVHPDAAEPLRSWFREAERAAWRTPADLKSRHASASFVGNDRVVFNIGGNKYRLVVRVNFQKAVILIRFIGTHAEYDDIDAGTI